MNFNNYCSLPLQDEQLLSVGSSTVSMHTGPVTVWPSQLSDGTAGRLHALCSVRQPAVDSHRCHEFKLLTTFSERTREIAALRRCRRGVGGWRHIVAMVQCRRRCVTFGNVQLRRERFFRKSSSALPNACKSCVHGD